VRSYRWLSPLRYPGGKARVAPFVKAVLESNAVYDGHYVEPYAGGASVALELLMHDRVQTIHINDIDKDVFFFWLACTQHSASLARLVRKAQLTVKEWDKQKRVFSEKTTDDPVTRGFATLFLNRTNRSGILNGGIIGGRSQEGKWGIDARFNRDSLAERIELIGRLAHRIELTNSDAIDLMERYRGDQRISQTLFYLDPPYYQKGNRLYLNFYGNADHEAVAKTVSKLSFPYWLVSYDRHEFIMNLYKGHRSVEYDLSYSARTMRTGTEVMFFSNSMQVDGAVDLLAA